MEPRRAAAWLMSRPVLRVMSAWDRALARIWGAWWLCRGGASRMAQAGQSSAGIWLVRLAAGTGPGRPGPGLLRDASWTVCKTGLVPRLHGLVLVRVAERHWGWPVARNSQRRAVPAWRGLGRARAWRVGVTAAAAMAAWAGARNPGRTADALGVARLCGRDRPLRGGRRRPRTERWPLSTVVPGVQRAPGPVWVSCVRNVENLLWVRIPGTGMRRRCGKPTVRGAELPWRDRVPKKRMPGGRKAGLRQGGVMSGNAKVFLGGLGGRRVLHTDTGVRQAWPGRHADSAAAAQVPAMGAR
jgi:hypothetical protein